MAHRFDIDDTEIAAAQAGVGAVLASVRFIRRELDAGGLAEVPGCPRFVAGAYWMQPSPTRRRATERVMDWLRERVRQTDAPPS